jgi:hypothetical protein
MAFENDEHLKDYLPDETPEDRDRAIEDAVKEWEAEGGALEQDPEPEQGSPVIGQRWVGSFYVCDVEGDIIHGITKQDCNSYAEAVGLAYLELEQQYPQEEGFTAPRIVMDEDPIFKVPGIPHDCQLVDPA